VQTERLAGLDLDLEEYKTNYQLTEERLAKYAPKALDLHPGPIIRGLELTAAVADGENSCVLEQVHNGLPIRMALVERAYAALDALETPTLFGQTQLDRGSRR
jgi:aspartate carbamoyltransferase catalytic subunit